MQKNRKIHSIRSISWHRCWTMMNKYQPNFTRTFCRYGDNFDNFPTSMLGKISSIIPPTTTSSITVHTNKNLGLPGWIIVSMLTVIIIWPLSYGIRSMLPDINIWYIWCKIENIHVNSIMRIYRYLILKQTNVYETRTSFALR